MKTLTTTQEDVSRDIPSSYNVRTKPVYLNNGTVANPFALSSTETVLMALSREQEDVQEYLFKITPPPAPEPVVDPETGEETVAEDQKTHIVFPKSMDFYDFKAGINMSSITVGTDDSSAQKYNFYNYDIGTAKIYFTNSKGFENFSDANTLYFDGNLGNNYEVSTYTCDGNKAYCRNILSVAGNINNDYIKYKISNGGGNGNIAKVVIHANDLSVKNINLSAYIQSGNGLYLDLRANNVDINNFDNEPSVTIKANISAQLSGSHFRIGSFVKINFNSLSATLVNTSAFTFDLSSTNIDYPLRIDYIKAVIDPEEEFQGTTATFNINKSTSADYVFTGFIKRAGTHTEPDQETGEDIIVPNLEILSTVINLSCDLDDKERNPEDGESVTLNNITWPNDANIVPSDNLSIMVPNYVYYVMKTDVRYSSHIDYIHPYDQEGYDEWEREHEATKNVTPTDRDTTFTIRAKAAGDSYKIGISGTDTLSAEVMEVTVPAVQGGEEEQP